METPPQPGIIWDDTKNLYEQSVPTITKITLAMLDAQEFSTTENCNENFTRPTEIIYHLNENFNIKVNPVYINTPNSVEFMDETDKIINIISK